MSSEIKLGVPVGGFGTRLNEMHSCLDENLRRWLGDDPGRAARRCQRCRRDLFPRRDVSRAAFVSRWCAGSKVEISDGAFRVREDQPAPRVTAGLHKTF